MGSVEFGSFIRFDGKVRFWERPRLEFDAYDRASVRFRIKDPGGTQFKSLIDNIDCVNDADCWGMPAGTLVYSAVDWEQKLRGISEYYLEGRLQFDRLLASFTPHHTPADFVQVFQGVEFMTEERRLRRYFLPMRELLVFLRMGHHGIENQWVDLPEVQGIPEGAKILSVGFDPSRQAFEAVVEHPSFDSVEPGQVIPAADCFTVERRAFRVIPATKDEPAAVDLGQPFAIDVRGRPITNSAGQPIPVSYVGVDQRLREIMSEMQFRYGGRLVKPLALTGPPMAAKSTLDQTKSPQSYDLSRFTDRARKVLQLANQEAQRFNHEWVGREHILLGMVKEGGGVAARALQRLGIDDIGKLRAIMHEFAKPGEAMVTMGKLPFTPRTKRVLELANTEAREFGHHYVGTEHLLAALATDDETAGITKDVFLRYGHELKTVRKTALEFVDSVLGPIGLMAGDEVAENVKVLAAPKPDARMMVVLDEIGEMPPLGANMNETCTCRSLLNGHEPGCPLAAQQ